MHLYSHTLPHLPFWQSNHFPFIQYVQTIGENFRQFFHSPLRHSAQLYRQSISCPNTQQGSEVVYMYSPNHKVLFFFSPYICITAIQQLREEQRFMHYPHTLKLQSPSINQESDSTYIVPLTRHIPTTLGNILNTLVHQQ